MTRNPIAREPVLTQLVFGVLTWAITRYGLDVSEAQALEIAGVAVVVLAPFVRQLVTPSANLSRHGPVEAFGRQPGVGGYPSGSTPASEMPPPDFPRGEAETVNE